MTEFELGMSVPADLQYAEMLRLVAAQAARQAGAIEAEAVAFGADVEQAARDCVSGAAAPAIAVLLRSHNAEVEGLLTCGRTIRVARALPLDV